MDKEKIILLIFSKKKVNILNFLNFSYSDDSIHLIFSLFSFFEFSIISSLFVFNDNEKTVVLKAKLDNSINQAMKKSQEPAMELLKTRKKLQNGGAKRQNKDMQMPNLLLAFAMITVKELLKIRKKL